MEMIYPMKVQLTSQKVKRVCLEDELKKKNEKGEEKEEVIEVEERVFLVPNLLPEKQPTLEGWSTYVSSSDYEIGRVFQFHFLPLGFFAKLVIRVLYWNLELITAWRSGVLVRLDTKASSELALITFNSSSYTLRLRVRGNKEKPGNLLQYLVQSIIDLVSGWFNTEYETFIPCIHCVQDPETSKKYLFQYCFLSNLKKSFTSKNRN